MPNFWEFRAATEDPKVGELLLYGVISSESWWGDEVTPKQFQQDLAALGDIDELRVYVNSGGGDVFAGQAIHSMIKRHKARVIVYVDGLAASIASVIAMAGDVVRMPRNAMMMIHQPWSWGYGNAAEMRRLADDLDKIAESLVAAYAEKTGLEREKIIEIMDAETWLTAEEAVELGFADEIETAKDVAASVDGARLTVNGQQHDLSRFRNRPKLAFLPRTERPARPAATAPAPSSPDPTTPAERRTAPLSLYERRLALNER
jgi:ATP-dependent Clp protease protease subunit